MYLIDFVEVLVPIGLSLANLEAVEFGTSLLIVLELIHRTYSTQTTLPAFAIIYSIVLEYLWWKIQILTIDQKGVIPEGTTPYLSVEEPDQSI